VRCPSASVACADLAHLGDRVKTVASYAEIMLVAPTAVRLALDPVRDLTRLDSGDV